MLRTARKYILPQWKLSRNGWKYKIPDYVWCFISPRNSHTQSGSYFRPLQSLLSQAGWGCLRLNNVWAYLGGGNQPLYVHSVICLSVPIIFNNIFKNPRLLAPKRRKAKFWPNTVLCKNLLEGYTPPHEGKCPPGGIGIKAVHTLNHMNHFAFLDQSLTPTGGQGLIIHI